MLSIVMQHYQNNALALQRLAARAALPSDILAATEFILVDDGSTVPLDADPPPNTVLVRVLEDIPWNVPGARNLGVHHARHDWLLVTDLDHTFAEADLRRILASLKDLSPVHGCMFKRVLDDGTPRGRHCNTLLLSKRAFNGQGGSDEDFCGHYGEEDLLFNWRWKMSGRKFRLHPSATSEMLRAGRTQGLSRDPTRNVALKKAKMAAGEFVNRGLRLRFPWEKVADTRQPQPKSGSRLPPIDDLKSRWRRLRLRVRH